MEYNEEHGIIPQTIVKKDVREILEISTHEEYEKKGKGPKTPHDSSRAELRATIEQLTNEMKAAAQIAGI